MSWFYYQPPLKPRVRQSARSLASLALLWGPTAAHQMLLLTLLAPRCCSSVTKNGKAVRIYEASQKDIPICIYKYMQQRMRAKGLEISLGNFLRIFAWNFECHP